MKILISAACAVLLLASIAAGENVSTPVNPPYAFSRGVANLMFGWLELPRGLVYENARIPVVGFVSGPVKGSALMTWRTLAGAIDVAAMGLTRDGLYTELVPEFVWDADWVPACGEDVVGMQSIESDPCIDESPTQKPRRAKRKAAPCKPCADSSGASVDEAALAEPERLVAAAPIPAAAFELGAWDEQRSGEPEDGSFAPAKPMQVVAVGPAPRLPEARERLRACEPERPVRRSATAERTPFGLGDDDEVDVRVRQIEADLAMLEEHIAPLRDSLSLPIDRQRAHSR
jgi:putative exosortase-associated protein (TIGR04073 family)